MFLPILPHFVSHLWEILYITPEGVILSFTLYIVQCVGYQKPKQLRPVRGTTMTTYDSQSAIRPTFNFFRSPYAISAFRNKY